MTTTHSSRKHFLKKNLHLSSYLGHQVIIRGNLAKRIPITRRAQLGFWMPAAFSGQPRAGPNPSRTILRATSCLLTAAVSEHTYLKTILLSFAFTSCWVDSESKGNSSRGTELNWNAPTLTCSGRQRAQGLRAGSGHKHS